MDATLVTVTVLSMSMAAALSAIVWRMLRLERQRSNARVAALSAAARVSQASVGQASVGQASVGQAFRPDEADDLPLTSPAISEGAPLFAPREQESPWGARFAVMAAVALVVSSLVLFSLAAHARNTRALSLAVPRAAASQVSPAAAASSAQLELLALRDSRQAGSLTITGMVQNPRTGTQLSRVAVTAYTFDDRGSFLASGRALIDITALAPGDESPFTVTVPVSDTVARYRIGFRDDAGRVIAHVDRRQQGPIAALRQTSPVVHW